MRFVYKIYSGYDGFSPRRIGERMLPGNRLQIGWVLYADVVDPGAEVWVYFHGPHRFEPGVYVKGFVQEVNVAKRRVLLKVREYSIDRPLSDAPTSAHIARLVAARGRQVFVLPEEWDAPSQCDVFRSAISCRERRCGSCPEWRGLPGIALGDYALPWRLRIELEAFAPAYWVVPSRCYLHGAVAAAVKRTSEIFYRFKTGDRDLAYPLALGMYTALRRRSLLSIDAVVPVPLSPDKIAAGELHRTRLLAAELGRLLGCHVADVLSLTLPISKRRLRTNEGLGVTAFEERYSAALDCSRVSPVDGTVLVVDDVSTEGSTLRCVVRKVKENWTGAHVVVATAGLMVLKHTVLNEAAVAAGALAHA